MVNVYTWLSPRVPGGRAALENASLIGRTANVALPQMVPQYVSHLLSLGLVEAGPEDPPSLATEYEVLMAETSVLAAIKKCVARTADRQGRKKVDIDAVAARRVAVGGRHRGGTRSVSSVSVLAISSWTEIKADFSAYWMVYLSMPFVAAFVGWSTKKIVALEMLYRPIEFRGGWGGPFGWQGIVPRRAGKVGSKTIDLLTSNLLKPEELLDRIDANEAVDALRGPLAAAIDDISRDLADEIRPGLWDALPESARRGIQERMHRQAPHIVENMLTEMKADLPRYLDLHFMAVTTLVRNKEKLVKLMRSVTTDAMAFVRRSGIYFGLVIGLVQMVAWALFKNPWIMPAFGFAVGFISDYIALNMLFRPMHPRKFLGFIPLSGTAACRARQDHSRLRQDPGRRSVLARAYVRRDHQRPPARTSCSRWPPRKSTPPSTPRPPSRARWSHWRSARSDTGR